jgi:hypothetical protein
MGRTFLRQDTQIRRSDVYDDTVAPTEAAYETNPVHIEEDLNNLRSQVQNILNRNGASMPAGNWYDNIVAPSTFESGTQRGVSEINQQLHDLERKRVLVENHILTDITVPASVAATGSLDATGGNFAAGETVTTGTKTYTFTSPLGSNDGDVLLGATASDSLDNLIAAINLAAGSGTLYAAATTANGFVSAAAGAGDTMDVTALVAGSGGNVIATTVISTNVVWGAATLSGGAGDVVVLALGELPTNTTAAVGAVTTLGTVAAYNSVFPNRSLAEVGGTTAISPKNLSIIVDADTRDPIMSGGRVVYALFQTETATDGHTMTGTTPNRAMLSFVRINAAGDDLEFVPASDIAGKDINYTTKTRKAMEDLTEQDFLRGAEIDVPSSATVTRQVAYDNQGTVPVDLTTNATLDLEGAGLIWAIRDDLEANLFRVVEGSAGGTSTVEVSAGVDTFDVNAVVNDFNAGATINSGGTRPIAVGVTDGVIESTAGDLRVNATTELFLDDGNQTGSTWAQTDGIKLSETTTEWDDFETMFGEVSLLNAIHQAATMGGRKTKVYANVTTTTVANNDVGGVGGGANLDAQLPDMSANVFLTDYDVFLNGNLLRPGANAAANNDYYPGTSLANGQLMFEFTVKVNDVLCVIPYGPAV